MVNKTSNFVCDILEEVVNINNVEVKVKEINSKILKPFLNKMHENGFVVWFSKGLNKIDQAKAPITITINKEQLDEKDIKVLEKLLAEKHKKKNGFILTHDFGILLEKKGGGDWQPLYNSFLRKLIYTSFPFYVGILTSGKFLAYDIDTKEDFDKIQILLRQNFNNEEYYIEETLNGYHIIFKLDEIPQYLKSEKIAMKNGKEFSRHRNKYLITHPTVRFDGDKPYQIKKLTQFDLWDLKEVKIDRVLSFEEEIVKILKNSGWDIKKKNILTENKQEENNNVKTINDNKDNEIGESKQDGENILEKVYSLIEFPENLEEKGWRSDFIFSFAVLGKYLGLQPEEVYNFLKKTRGKTKFEDNSHNYIWFEKYVWNDVENYGISGVIGAFKEALKTLGKDPESITKTINEIKKIIENGKKDLVFADDENNVYIERIKMSDGVVYRGFTILTKKNGEKYEKGLCIFSMKRPIENAIIYTNGELVKKKILWWNKGNKWEEIDLNEVGNDELLRLIKGTGIKEQDYTIQLVKIVEYIKKETETIDKKYTSCYGVLDKGIFLPPEWELYGIYKTDELVSFEKMINKEVTEEEIIETAKKFKEFLEGDYPSKLIFQFGLVSVFGRYLFKTKKIGIVPNLIVIGKTMTGKSTRVEICLSSLLKNTTKAEGRVTEFAYTKLQYMTVPIVFEEREDNGKLLSLLKASATGEITNRRGKKNGQLDVNEIVRNNVYITNYFRERDPALLNRFIILDFDQENEMKQVDKKIIAYLKKNVWKLGWYFWKNIQTFKEVVDQETEYIDREEGGKEFIKLGGKIAKKLFEMLGIDYKSVEYKEYDKPDRLEDGVDCLIRKIKEGIHNLELRDKIMYEVLVNEKILKEPVSFFEVCNYIMEKDKELIKDYKKEKKILTVRKWCVRHGFDIDKEKIDGKEVLCLYLTNEGVISLGLEGIKNIKQIWYDYPEIVFPDSIGKDKNPVVMRIGPNKELRKRCIKIKLDWE